MFKTKSKVTKNKCNVKLKGILTQQEESKSNLDIEDEVARYNQDILNKTDYFDDGTILQNFESTTAVFTVKDRLNNILEDIKSRTPMAIGGNNNAQ